MNNYLLTIILIAITSAAFSQELKCDCNAQSSDALKKYVHLFLVDRLSEMEDQFVRLSSDQKKIDLLMHIRQFQTIDEIEKKSQAYYSVKLIKKDNKSARGQLSYQCQKDVLSKMLTSLKLIDPNFDSSKKDQKKGKNDARKLKKNETAQKYMEEYVDAEAAKKKIANEKAILDTMNKTLQANNTKLNEKIQLDAGAYLAVIDLRDEEIKRVTDKVRTNSTLDSLEQLLLKMQIAIYQRQYGDISPYRYDSLLSKISGDFVNTFRPYLANLKNVPETQLRSKINEVLVLLSTTNYSVFPLEMPLILQESVYTDTLLFEEDEIQLDVDDMAKLDHLLQQLRNTTNYSIRIEGFASQTGSKADNLAISNSRCYQVRKYLQSMGISREIVVEPWGQSTDPEFRAVIISVLKQKEK
jgi:outer membrane protein OmpA-like peptidoglycan-associated protein